MATNEFLKAQSKRVKSSYRTQNDIMTDVY